MTLSVGDKTALARAPDEYEVMPLLRGLVSAEKLRRQGMIEIKTYPVRMPHKNYGQTLWRITAAGRKERGR